MVKHLYEYFNGCFVGFKFNFSINTKYLLYYQMPLPHTWVSADCAVISFMMIMVQLWPHVSPILKLSWIPRSVFAIGLGLLVGLGWPSTQPMFIFEPELFLFLLLPPIIFGSGLTFRRETLTTTWKSSLLLATLGTAISVVLIAWGTLSLQYFFGFDPFMTIPEALAFGAILSPTDPVATLSIMKKQRKAIAPHVRYVIENESLLNDAVAVVLVHLAGHLKAIRPSTVLYVIFIALCTTTGSIAWGWSVGEMIRKCKWPPPAFLICMALIVYSCAETVGGSGIVSLFVYGLVIAPDAPYIISDVHTLAELGEIYIYIVMGCVIHTVETKYWAYALGTVMACLFARLFHVFILGGFLKCCCGRPWKISELLFVSMCGIRGAIALALAFSLSGPHAQMVRAATFTVVILTTLCFGSLTTWMIRAFDLRKNIHFTC